MIYVFKPYFEFLTRIFAIWFVNKPRNHIFAPPNLGELSYLINK